VNFFGHAAAARLVDDDPGFLLGAMAPDLLKMCGAIAGAATSPKVAAGRAHHFEVDGWFHASPVFTGLAAWAAGALGEAGVARGGARGAAHVGIELLLDGVLAGDGPARAAYARSLEGAEEARAPFLFADEPSRERWRMLVVRLRGGGIPEGYRDPDFVAARIVGALSRRPRLALGAGDAAALRAFLPSLARRVAEDAHALCGGLLVPAPAVRAAAVRAAPVPVTDRP
jgi:hypothetical protein